MVKNQNKYFYLSADKFLEPIINIPHSKETQELFYQRFLRLKGTKESNFNIWQAFFVDYFKKVLNERIKEQINLLKAKKPYLHQFSGDKHDLEDLLNVVNDEFTDYKALEGCGKALQRIEDDIAEKKELEKTYKHDLFWGIIIGTLLSALVDVVLHYIGWI